MVCVNRMEIYAVKYNAILENYSFMIYCYVTTKVFTVKQYVK